MSRVVEMDGANACSSQEVAAPSAGASSPSFSVAVSNRFALSTTLAAGLAATCEWIHGQMASGAKDEAALVFQGV